jgi:hypothetical protein
MAVKPGSGGMLASKTRTGAHYRMRSWRTSPREAVHSAWRYSVFVKVMKGALPMTALALGVAVLGYVLQPREGNKVALTFEQLDRVDNDLAMLKPQLTGTDDDGRPFKVTAATAVQDSSGSELLRLAAGGRLKANDRSRRGHGPNRPHKRLQLAVSARVPGRPDLVQQPHGRQLRIRRQSRLDDAPIRVQLGRDRRSRPVLDHRRLEIAIEVAVPNPPVDGLD